jgi:two-component system cell cycle sensor histidine kinase/response regulator CckA
MPSPPPRGNAPSLPLQEYLLRSVQQAVIATDLEGRVTYWNRFAESLFGWKREEVIGRNVLEFTPAPNSLEKSAEIFDRISNGESWSGDLILQRRDGSLFTAWVTDSPIIDTEGKVIGIVGATSDIADRRHAREELMHREAQLIEAQEIAHLGSWEVDMATREHSWSDETYRIFGIRKYDHPPTWDDLLAVVHEADQHLLREATEWPGSEGVFPAIDLRIIKSTGEERIVHLRGRAVAADEGPARLVGFVQDITDRRKAEAELRRRSAQQEAVARLSQSALRGADAKTLFFTAAEMLAEVLAVEVVDVLRRVAGRAMQVVESTRGIGSEAGPVILIDETSSVAQAMTTGNTVVIEDASSESRCTLLQVHEGSPALSGMATAIFDSHWVPVGAIAVSNARPARFSEDDITFLQAVANVLAQALDRQRKDDQLQNRAAQQIAIAELSRKAIAGVTQELLNESSRVIRYLLAMDLTGYLECGDDGWLRVLAGDRWISGQETVANTPETQAGFTLRTTAPVIVNDYASERRFNTRPFADNGIVSGISVAVRGAKQTFGVLTAHTRSPRALGEPEANFLEAVANILAEAFERETARRALIESEERYRAVVEGASEIIYTLDRNGRITSLNKAFETITGWKREDWLGRELIGLVPPDQHARLIEQFGTILSGSRVEGESDLMTASGGTVTLFNSAAPLRDGEQITRIHGFARDVTAARLAEAERQRLTRDMQLLLESTDEGVCAIDLRGLCTLANRAAGALLGVQPADLIAMRLHTIIHPDCPGCPIESVLTGGEGQRVHDAVFHRAGGAEFPVEYAVAPIVDDGVTKGAVLTFNDITSRRKLEARLEQANRLTSLGRLATTIAHEFNNVLMGISPFVELLRRADQTFEKRITALEHIGKSVKRGKRISDEILRFANPAEPAMDSIPLKPWIESFRVELQSVIGPNYNLAIDLVDPSLHLLGDPTQMHQIFTNLVLNARDAMPGGGPVRISLAVEPPGSEFPFGVVTQPERFVHISIEDRGYGIGPEVLRHMFEPLFTTKRNGTGLGLAVTHQVVKKHGGDLFVESTVGVGTTFHIFLPRASGPPTEHEAQPVPNKVAKSLRRVLLVEDEPAVSSGVALLLESEGIQVDIVDNGSAVLRAIEERKPDAVVLDIGLPDIEGTRVYQAIADRYPDLPVVFSTGHGDEKQLESYLHKRHVGYLMKPYDIARLLESLHRVTGV